MPNKLINWFMAARNYHRARTMLHYRGSILTLWATIERAIDNANFVAWEMSGRSISNVVPQSFRWKIQLFEKLHKKVVLFDDLKPMADDIIAGLHAQKHFRNMMAHGFYYVTKPPWEFSIHVHEKDGSLSKQISHVSKAEFKLREKALVDLCEKAARYGNALVDKLIKHNLGDGGG